MTILETPSVKSPAKSLFTLKNTSEMLENQFNAAVQVGDGDDYWVGEVEYQNTDRVQTLVYRNFIHSLRGPSGDFWFTDVTHSQRGGWGGSPVVDGNNQDGTLLAVRGLPTNSVVGLVGDRFQLGDHLHELTQDATTNASGKVDLHFLPDIRFIPVDGQALNVSTPRAKCMLLPGQSAPQPTTKGLLSSFSYKFRESIR